MVRCLLLFSGKRKSGKDYCAKLLESRLSDGFKVKIVGVSHSLKEEYARIHNLSYDDLLGEGAYKEKYRKDMIRWGEEMREQDEGYFCRKALSCCEDVDIGIISDCRRISDMNFFSKAGPSTISVRVQSPIECRQSRGFLFAEGIDDAESECGLDNYSFDVVIHNDMISDVTQSIDSLVQAINNRI